MLYRLRVLPNSNVELAVLAKVYCPTVVVGRSTQAIKLEDERLTPRNGRISTSREPGDAVASRVAARRSLRIVDIDEAVRRKVRAKRNTQQAALTRRVDPALDVQERLRQQLAVLDDTQRPPFLGHEQATIRRELHRGRPRKTSSDLTLRKAVRKRCGPGRRSPENQERQQRRQKGRDADQTRPTPAQRFRHPQSLRNTVKSHSPARCSEWISSRLSDSRVENYSESHHRDENLRHTESLVSTPKGYQLSRL